MGTENVSALLRQFVEERNWSQFHTEANLAKSISIEAGELLETFQWSDEADGARVREELADVLIYALLLADKIGANLEDLVREKLAINTEKYPVDKAFGRSDKYDRL